MGLKINLKICYKKELNFLYKKKRVQQKLYLFKKAVKCQKLHANQICILAD